VRLDAGDIVRSLEAFRRVEEAGETPGDSIAAASERSLERCCGLLSDRLRGKGKNTLLDDPVSMEGMIGHGSEPSSHDQPLGAPRP
jgi:hypothetical protein